MQAAGPFKPKPDDTPDKDGYYWRTDEVTKRAYKIRKGQDVDKARANAGIESVDGGGHNSNNPDNTKEKRKQYLERRRKQHETSQQYEDTILKDMTYADGKPIKKLDHIFMYTTAQLGRVVNELSSEQQDIIKNMTRIKDMRQLGDARSPLRKVDSIVDAITKQRLFIPKKARKEGVVKVKAMMEFLSKNSEEFRRVERKTDEINKKLAESVRKDGIVFRGTSTKELENMAKAGGKVGAGRDSEFGNDFISTSIREEIGYHFMQDRETKLDDYDNIHNGVMIEYDLSGLKEGEDYKPMTYKPYPDILFGDDVDDRLGENWEDASQSVGFASAGEVYLKPGTKVPITRIVLDGSQYANQKKVEATRKRLEKAGFGDKIEVTNIWDAKAIQKSLQAGQNENSYVASDLSNNMEEAGGPHKFKNMFSKEYRDQRWAQTSFAKTAPREEPLWSRCLAEEKDGGMNAEVKYGWAITKI